MLLTTTNNIEGKEIKEYVGIVSSEVIMGANIVRDFFASITDVIGGRSGTYENKLSEAREKALEELTEKARQKGADAVIGIDLDFETVQEGMLMCVATGTAVKF